MNFRHQSLIATSFALLTACGGATAEGEGTLDSVEQAAVDPNMSVPAGDIAASLAGPQRSDEHRARDQFRNPAETLAFFGVEPTHTVVEVWPGGGWYSEVLAPYLRDGGTLIAAGYDPQDPGRRGGYERTYRAKLAERPGIYDQVQHTVFTADSPMSDLADDSADAVLVFRAVHNMVRNDAGAAPFFTAMARVIRPGGVLGIVAHRMPEDAGPPNDGTAGYLTEALVISLAEAAGFTLEERSDVNANPQDTHVHPEGVWSMPPVLRGGDESLRALGESDRMTLRFRLAGPMVETRAAEAGVAPGAVQVTPEQQQALEAQAQ